jgi:hypothetical protein
LLLLLILLVMLATWARGASAAARFPLLLLLQSSRLTSSASTYSTFSSKQQLFDLSGILGVDDKVDIGCVALVPVQTHRYAAANRMWDFGLLEELVTSNRNLPKRFVA